MDHTAESLRLIGDVVRFCTVVSVKVGSCQVRIDEDLVSGDIPYLQGVDPAPGAEGLVVCQEGDLGQACLVGLLTPKAPAP